MLRSIVYVLFLPWWLQLGSDLCSKYATRVSGCNHILRFVVAVRAFVYRTTVYIMLYPYVEQQATDIIMRLAVLWS